MSLFRVTVGRPGREVAYTIEESAHNDTAALAAAEALRTFARHGHSRFPYNDDSLTVGVERIDDPEAEGTSDAA